MSTNEQQAAQVELATRLLEEKSKPQRESFRGFIPSFYEDYFKRPFVGNYHYDLIADTLQDVYENPATKKQDLRIVMINVSPQSGKSLLCSQLFPVWCMGNGNTKLIVGGYSLSLVQRFSEQARGAYESREFKKIFPRRLDLSNRGVETWGTPGDTSLYQAIGVGGSTTGKAADIFLIDDPLNPADVAVSGLMLERVNDWFSHVAVTRLSPMGKKMMVIIMQRLHDNDLCGYLLRKYADKFASGQHIHLNFPAIEEKDGKKKSFFPEMFSLPFLEEKKMSMTTELGSNVFAAQYLQNPIDMDNSDFNRRNFRYYEDKDLKNKKLRTIIAVDPAISEKRTADNSAIEVISKAEDGIFYRRRGKAGKMSPEELLKNIFTLQNAFDCPVVIESVGFQRMIAENIRQKMKETGKYFLLLEIKNQGEKEARIRQNLQPLYENARIYHLKEDEYSDFEEELERFPKGQHDDRIDSLAIAVSQIDYGYVEHQNDEDEFSGETDSDKLLEECFQ